MDSDDDDAWQDGESLCEPFTVDKADTKTVTTIVGFTERGDAALLYNSAAVFERGSVVGIYRKVHPAIRRSVYAAGAATPVFHAGALTFGIVICNDSNFPELATAMAAQGAAALFVPTNNGLPAHKAVGLVDAARAVDVATAPGAGRHDILN